MKSLYGNIRLIAVGEAWYRLAELCARTACLETGPSLATLQPGVGIPGNVSIGHAVCSALLADPEPVLLSVHQELALNCGERSAVFAIVKECCLSNLRFVQWVYCAHADLFIVGALAQTFSLISASGLL